MRPTSDDTYLTSAQVRQRYGNASSATLKRWIKSERLPKPDMRIGRRVYWRTKTLIAHERKMAAA